MLDGAGASTFLDLIDERSQSDNSNKSIYEVKKFKEIKSEDNSRDLPFTNVPRDQLKRKQIVFIDKQVPDYEKLAKSFRKNVEINFIESNHDGFKKIEQTLENGKKYSAIHIIGHGSAGQILFGNSLLTNESIENYKSTLGSIGESLTKKGDILFYGCNIAANDKGEALLKKISNFTKADIAASNDLTGKGGDWELEKKYGIVETENVQVVDYDYDLAKITGAASQTKTVGADGITSIYDQYIKAYTGSDRITDFVSNKDRSGGGWYGANHGETFQYWRISLEKAGITSGSIKQNDGSGGDSKGIHVVGDDITLDATTSDPLDSYMLFLDENSSGKNPSPREKISKVTFDGEIKAIMTSADETASKNVGGMNFDDGGTYPNNPSGGRSLEKKGHPSAVIDSGSVTDHDWVRFENNNKTIVFAADNGRPGDYIRVLVAASPANTAPVAADSSETVTENTYGKYVTGSYKNVASASTDADGDKLTVTHLKYDKWTDKNSNGIVDAGEIDPETSNVTEGKWNKFYTRYGVLWIHSNGEYSFNAARQAIPDNQTATYDADDTLIHGVTNGQFDEVNKLDLGDSATLTFTYTIKDTKGATDTGDITVTINGANDTPIATDDTNSVSEEGDIFRSSVISSNKGLLANDTDADGDDNSSNFTVTGIASGPTEINSFTTISSGGQQSIETSFGTLTVHSDGSYSYQAKKNPALGSGETEKDVFRYSVRDDSLESNLYNNKISETITTDNELNSIGILTIEIHGVDDTNNAPVTTDDTGYVYEDFTLTVANGASANDGYSTSPFTGGLEIAADSDNNSDHGDHTGDLLSNDTDADNDTLNITGIRLSTATGPFETTTYSSVASGSSYNSSGTQVTGTYGTLTIGADGSYSYAATASATDALDNDETVKEYFEYKVNDGKDDVIGNITITVKGINDDPVGVNDTDAVTYGSTLNRANGNEYDLLIDDTDVDGDDDESDFTITSITATTANGSAQTTFSSNSETVTGQYGTLVLNSNGSYTYDPTNNSNAKALANGATATDVFTYVFNDGTSKLTEHDSGSLKTDPSGTATLTITVTGKTPRATDDTGRIEAGSTLTVIDDAVDGGDGDYDDDSGDHTGNVLGNDVGSSTTVTGIQLGPEASPVASGTVGSSFTGDYGDLTINADGSYTYVANNAGSLTAGQTATETFTYTVTDATGNTDTATITITILGVDDDPVGEDDTGYIEEGGTLTVDDEDGESGTDNNENNESGDTSGGVLNNDSDLDGNETLFITDYGHLSNGNNGTAGSGSVEGDYGTLTLETDGSYTYVANTDITGLDTGLTVTDVFTYTLIDIDDDGDQITSNPDIVRITITIVGLSAPTAENDTATVEENSSISVTKIEPAQQQIAAENEVEWRARLLNEENQGSGVSFSTDGMKMFITGIQENEIHEYALTAPFDVSTYTHTRSVSLNWDNERDNDADYSDDQGDWVRGHTWNKDGSKLFVMNWDGGLAGDALASYRVISYDLSTPFDTSTISNVAPTSSTSFDIGTSNSMRALKISSDGKKFFFIDKDARSIIQWSLSTAYDLSTASTSEDTTMYIGNWAAMRSIEFSPDGHKMFLGDAKNDKIHQYSLTTAFDLSDTVKHEGSISLLNSQTQPMGITFGAGGTRLFIHETHNNDMIHEYHLRTPYNLIDLDDEHSGDVLDNDSDDDGDTLTLSSVRTGSTLGSGTAGTIGDQALTGTYGVLTLNAEGDYTYNANTGISATEALDAGDIVYDYFNYTITDDSSTASALLTIKIIGVNDNPSATNDTGYINRDETLTVANGAAAVSGTSSGSNSGDVLLNETDVDAHDSLVVVGTVAHTGASQIVSGTTTSKSALNVDTDVGTSVAGQYGALTLNEDGSYEYIANNSNVNSLADGDEATDIFTFTVSDTQGGIATQTLTIKILGTTIALVDDTDTVNEDATVTVADGADEDLLIDDTAVTIITHIQHSSQNSAIDVENQTYSHASATTVTGTYGTLTIGSDGSYQYVADQNGADGLAAGATADDVFTYTANSETATLTITVTGIGPEAVNDTGRINENLTLIVADGSTGEDGEDTDKDNESGDHTGDIILNDDDNSSYDSESLRVTRAKVDGGSFGSVISAGESQTVTGTYGTLTIHDDGEYSYEANNAEAVTKDATVTDTFVYEIMDDLDKNASTANLVITIIGANDAITAVDDTDSVNEGEAVTRGPTSEYSLDYDDTDIDGGNTYLTHQITAIRTGSSGGTAGTIGDPLTGTYGRLTVHTDGSYTYQANNDITVSGSRLVSGQSVTDTFNYTVSDTDGLTATAVLTITINGTNEAPTAADDFNTITVGGSAISKTSGNGALSNDADMEGDTLTVNGIRTGDDGETGTTGTVGSSLTGSYGNLTLNSDGSYSYELDENNTDLQTISTGEYLYETFTYTITDEAGQTSTAQITIRIEGVNDAPNAVDDKETLDLDETSEITNFDDSSKYVKANDTDVDFFDNISLNSVRTGKTNESGSSITVGSAFTAQYGSITFFADGGYNYTANSGLKDTLKPGEKLYEYFTYTITDSKGLTASAQLTIEIFGTNNSPAKVQDDGLGSLVQRASLNELETYDLPDRVPLPSSKFYEGQFKILKFNDALKLVDLRAQFKDKDGNYTTFSDGNPDDTLVLQFSVFNDPGVKLVKYKGEMKDGSALPDWIKVNPKTGVVVTDIPSNIDLLEFKVIGIDDKNNEFEIAVLIDATQLRQNRELAREFAGDIDGQNIEVKQDGNVEVQSNEEQTNNETENKSLNGNEVKIKSKKQINEFVKGDVFKPKPYLRDNKYIINLPDEIKNNLEKGIAVLRNGEKAPKWAKVNLNKGELILDPPKNLKNLNLTIVTMDQEGNKISNEIKSKINKRSAERFAKQMEIKEQSKFVSLTDQVGNEKFQFDNYGEDILRRL